MRARRGASRMCWSVFIIWRWNSKTHVYGSILLTINWYRYRLSQFTEGYIILEKARGNKPADRVPFSASVFVLSLSLFAGLTFPGNGLTVTCKLNKSFPPRAAFDYVFSHSNRNKTERVKSYIHTYFCHISGNNVRRTDIQALETESPRYWMKSYRVWFWPHWVSVLFWSNLSLLWPHSSFLKWYEGL